MKRTVRMISAVLACLLMASVLLCGCSKQETLVAPSKYVDYDLTEYVKLSKSPYGIAS